MIERRLADLLLISDLHLGSHLKPRMRGESVHLASRIEEIFPRFLDHYMHDGRRWQLVINGDFIDFWNIELGGLRGKGRRPAEEVAVARLHAVFDAHPSVEDALVRFLRAGHGIVFVTGNHDAELLYPKVRSAIVARLCGGDDGDVSRTDPIGLSSLGLGRIRFVRWFLRDPGGAWIEHGHKFDASCATPAALSPTRGGELVKTVAEVATRSFANLMPEIDYDAPDKFSTADYIRWAAARGWRFVLNVVLLYLRTAGRILALWAGPGRVDRAGRKAHDERLTQVAANAGLQMSALQALEEMAPPPSATRLWGLLSITSLDHVFVVAFAIAIGLAIGRLAGVPWLWLPIAVAVAIARSIRLRRRRRPRNVARDMLEVAASVGEVTGVPLVLMGHSHRGQLERFGDVVYANSGSWLDGSHLVVHRDPGTHRFCEVELRSWRNGGVVRMRALDVPHGLGQADTPPELESTATPPPESLELAASAARETA
jgi:UDP-2,3-diacylglucosamine pyrophosphatase LpxH